MAGAKAPVDLIGFLGTTKVVPCYKTTAIRSLSTTTNLFESTLSTFSKVNFIRGFFRGAVFKRRVRVQVSELLQNEPVSGASEEMDVNFVSRGRDHPVESKSGYK